LANDIVEEWETQGKGRQCEFAVVGRLVGSEKKTRKGGNGLRGRKNKIVTSCRGGKKSKQGSGTKSWLVIAIRRGYVSGELASAAMVFEKRKKKRKARNAYNDVFYM